MILINSRKFNLINKNCMMIFFSFKVNWIAKHLGTICSEGIFISLHWCKNQNFTASYKN